MTGERVEKVRFGVVGTNPYAEMHLAAVVALPNAELTAVCGRNSDRAHDVAGRYGVEIVHSDYRQMIDSGDIDAVLIVAPDPLHAPIAIAAAEAGVHSVCEKPLAATAEQAHEMWLAVDKAGVSNMSFFVLRHTAVHRRVRSLIDEGYLGRVSSAEFSLTHGFFRGGSYDWRFDAGVGTGAIGDLGCYLFDLASWYVGDVERVSAQASSSRHRPHPGGDPYDPANDSASGVLVCRSGAHATFTVSVVSHQAERMQSNVIRLYGTEGTLELEHNLRGGGRLRGARGSDEAFSDLLVDGSSGVDVGVRSDGPHAVGLGMFVDSILAGSAVECDYEHGWRVQQVVEAALAAAETGCWVNVGDADGQGSLA